MNHSQFDILKNYLFKTKLLDMKEAFKQFIVLTKGDDYLMSITL